jgi:hypothetical protein
LRGGTEGRHSCDHELCRSHCQCTSPFAVVEESKSPALMAQKRWRHNAVISGRRIALDVAGSGANPCKFQALGK